MSPDLAGIVGRVRWTVQIAKPVGDLLSGAVVMSPQAAISVLLLVVVIAVIVWFALRLVRYLPGDAQMPAQVLIVVLVMLIWRVLPLIPA